MTWSFTPLTLISAGILAMIWASNYLFLRKLEQQPLNPEAPQEDNNDEMTPRQIYEEGFE